jgi:hypothetical protein
VKKLVWRILFILILILGGYIALAVYCPELVAWETGTDKSSSGKVGGEESSTRNTIKLSKKESSSTPVPAGDQLTDTDRQELDKLIESKLQDRPKK